MKVNFKLHAYTIIYIYIQIIIVLIIVVHFLYKFCKREFSMVKKEEERKKQRRRWCLFEGSQALPPTRQRPDTQSTRSFCFNEQFIRSPPPRNTNILSPQQYGRVNIDGAHRVTSPNRGSLNGRRHWIIFSSLQPCVQRFYNPRYA